MGVRVAYGNRDDIPQAVEIGKIPPGSIIITKDEQDRAELMFYDTQQTLKQIVAKTRFDSIDEALSYAVQNSMDGQTITVLADGVYTAYIVQPDRTLSPISSNDETVESLLDRVAVLEGEAHTHQNMTVLDLISEERVEQWDKMVSTKPNFRDLVQTPGDVVVWYCGTATDV